MKSSVKAIKNETKKLNNAVQKDIKIKPDIEQKKADVNVCNDGRRKRRG